MKEFLTRSLAGLIFVALLISSVFLSQTAIFAVFTIFGLLCMFEFSKLIELKGFIQYIVFLAFLSVFVFWKHLQPELKIEEATMILLVFSIFVSLFLIRDLFSKKIIPEFKFKKYLLVSFYMSSSFAFLLLIPNATETYEPYIILGSFLLVWVNDSFAYLIGKKFGRQKLFERISPKKTVEGFLGGLLFSCIASYFIYKFTDTPLSFSSWLILAIIISSIGTIGDLIQSKFKRQANVKDSGSIMPGHGGIFDRLDSMIFSAPFIYLFLKILHYVS
ncbi:phosphatidate cytidylyltransferase [Kordia algicida OT-1]|uniref:Phosphatidate cytidylyltransferase n=1 Tax=Kordia algicida OT-1 TaxID=391587 RepID=A9E1F5_9FLAO|nr:phosphatidate cytidylyltransferase [Kordia algicida]EDP95622.1 phosphatidate cytidylyltransferase [Kordia algicida OT-1]